MGTSFAVSAAPSLTEMELRPMRRPFPSVTKAYSVLLDVAFYIYRYNIRTAHAVYGEGIGRACNELIVIVAAAVSSVVCNPDHLLLPGIGHAEVIHPQEFGWWRCPKPVPRWRWCCR